MPGALLVSWNPIAPPCPALPPHRYRLMRRSLSSCVLMLAAGLLGPSLARADAGWTNVSPGAGGAFTCVGAGPGGVIIVGSDISGAYRSTDRGASWTNIGYLNG